jgi:hypothetical protein
LPAVTGSGLSVLVIDRSADVLTVVLTVALERGLPMSVGELAVATLLMTVPLAVDGLTVARIVI